MGGKNAIRGTSYFQHLQDGNTEEDAAHAGYQGEENTLGDDLRKYHLRRGSDGSADAYLGGSLLYRYHHNVGNSDGAGKKGTDAYQPDEEVDALEQVVEHLEENFGIEHHNALFVRRVYAVGSCHGFSHPLGNAAHHYARFAGGGYDVYCLTPVISAAQNRLGQGDGFIGTTAEIDAVARTVIYAYHHIIGRVNSYTLAARITAARKEILVNLFADDANLALLAHIHLVDVSAVKHFRRRNLCVVRIYALGAAAEFLVAKHYRLVAAEEQRSNDIEFGHLVAQSLQVFLFHLPGAPLVESLVGFGGVLRPDDSGVGGKACEVVLQHLLQSLSATHQGDEHKHAPEHAEARKQTAALVPRDGVENLFICI